MRDLEELVLYYQSRRGVGHTFAMVNGAKHSRDCIILVATDLERKQIAQDGISSERILTLREFSDGNGLRGVDRPVVIDHHALCVLLRDVMEENMRLRAYNAKLERRA